MSEFIEVEHPRDKYGKFTTKELKELCKIDCGKFVKTGETTEVIPKIKEGEYKGSDKYPNTISHYSLKKQDEDFVEINLKSEIQKQFDKATPKERTKLAYKYIKDNLRGKYQANNGVEVLIQESSANKISHTLFETKIRTSPQLAELIKKGKFKKTEKANNHKLFNRFLYYDVLIKLGNKKYKALLNIGVNDAKECVLYDINKFEEK